MTTNPIKAIREHCLMCSGDSPAEVAQCTVTNCHLYPFRSGKNPYRKKREISDEQRAAMAERLAKAREEKTNDKD